MGTEVIRVQYLAKTSVCTSKEDGLRVFYAIKAAFDDNKNVELDFDGVKEIISGFLNPAIGVLYGSYNSEFISSHLKFINTTVDQRDTIKFVIRNAMRYYANLRKNEEIFNSAMENQD